MNSIEKSARESSGEFMYNLIWEKARKGNQKWLWLVVFGITVFQSVWVSLTFAGIFHFAFSKGYFPFWFIWLSMFAVNTLVDLFFFRENLFRSLSQFIAVAGDMNRVYQASEKVLARIFSKTLFLVSGVIAVAYACVLYGAYFWQLKVLSTTDLDVLGNALAHAKRWKWARRIYEEIGRRYMARLQNDVDTLQVSVSFGMACKWMLLDPTLTHSDRAFKKAMIFQVMIDYPQLPDEVTMRFREGLYGISVVG